MTIHLNKKTKWRVILIVLGMVLFISCILATTLGTARVKIVDSLEIVLHQIPIVGQFVDIDVIS